MRVIYCTVIKTWLEDDAGASAQSSKAWFEDDAGAFRHYNPPFLNHDQLVFTGNHRPWMFQRKC